MTRLTRWPAAIVLVLEEQEATVEQAFVEVEVLFEKQAFFEDKQSMLMNKLQNKE